MKRTGIICVLLSLVLACPAYADINSDLLVAAEYGDTMSVRALLEKGADVNVKNEYRYTALMLAAGNGYTDIVQTLLENGADVNARNDFSEKGLILPAARLSSNNYNSFLEYATAKKLEIKRNGLTALMIAAIKGHQDVVKVLIKNGADVNAEDEDGNTILTRAVYERHVEIVELLKQHGAKE